MLEQLGGRAKHFKSLGNPKSIVQEITKLYTHLLLDVVHTGVKVHKMDLEMYGLVE